MKHLYSIGYSQVKMLSTIEGLGEPDLSAIRRLGDFRGTAEDLELAAGLYDSVGEHANAENLRRMVVG
jgi:hypothetical protein